ncbi:cellulose-binding protein [Ophiostoma piceae UAMH 11346]|uniref:Cellulose-binding protein n=1 Tax=Ophiostoma piceae (strain UAMH 11346) TaxID=1262450 RepID=S3C4T1_OPHP1|nr:cellulose-binding protein [Ophiostoma piceae UAMH 11346]
MASNVGKWRGLLAVGLFSLITSAAPLANNERQCELSRYQVQPRAFILTDISNEPDDQMSLVRLLTYANELDIRGISVVTSTWKNDSVDLSTLREVISNGYANITQNLNTHVPAAASYPSASTLLTKTHAGHPVYGLAALQLPLSDAAKALITAGDGATSSHPLWVTLWGGANVLAEALQHVTKTRSAREAQSFVQKLRVYSISDQDDAGPWIRYRYPQLLYIVSLHGFSEYTQATWNGISGEVYRRFDAGGPNSTLVTNDWLQTHIRVGDLGHYYPVYQFIMEGDTPSFLPLIQNGLGVPEHPEWGSWGGRYTLADASGNTRVYSNAPDWVQGVSGEFYLSTFATIWRWRQEYQFDFATRMQWTVKNKYQDANHAPVAIINGTCGPAHIELRYKQGDSVILDASSSWDPDGDALEFNWFYYTSVTERLEGANINATSSAVSISNISPSGSFVRLTPNTNTTLHIILALQDKRALSETTYRRVILYPTA